MFIDNNCLASNRFVSFYINEYYITISYPLLNEIVNNKIISKIDCKLFLIDQRGIYGIKCPKDNIAQLPYFFFVFKNNYTFNIPMQLLFEDFDDNYQISLFRNKLKYNKLEDENFDDNIDKDEEISIGYCLIKYFNYSIFSYEDRSISFYSDLFIDNHPPKFLNKLIYFLLLFLICLLCISISFLIYVKLKIKYFYYNDLEINII